MTETCVPADATSGDDEYRDYDPTLNESHGYLLPEVLRPLKLRSKDSRIMDLGCGNGAVMRALYDRGWTNILGIDASAEGIRQCRRLHPMLDVYTASAYDDLGARFGTFDLVASLEVVEHLYAPRKWAATLRQLLRPDGVAVVSTPYHGYWKNLALAVSGRMDSHFTALWDHGHIKFWSPTTLTALLNEAGLQVDEVRRVGRVPPLAKSMVLTVRRGDKS